MRVQVIATGSTHDGIVPGSGRPDTVAAPPATYAGWQPRAVIGADSPGGLLLPPASPTAVHTYAPRAVWTDGELVVVADTGNHRVMIWHGLPATDGAAADVVLGQPDDHSEGPAAGGRGSHNGMHLPTGVLVHEGRLVVADAWHHRLLVWDAVPTRTGTPPDHVIGQPTAGDVEPNAGHDPDATTFYWPFGISVVDGRFHVADTGNRRVLVWSGGLPEPGQPADVVLGQPDAVSREENRGADVAADSFRWPHAVAGVRSPDGTAGLLVADAGNHRVLRWDSHPDGDRPADAVLGQLDFAGGGEFPYVSQAGRLRFPYGLATVGPGAAGAPAGIVVADTANNRVLLFDGHDAVHDRLPDAVLGQPTLAANGENRWESVGPDTLCWPYGVHWHRDASRPGPELIAVADSGNNRVVLWERS